MNRVKTDSRTEASAATRSSRVTIRRLELQGFGVYGRATRFAFGDGLNLLIAPNESGKSTFLAGLLAVLFGLPEKTDPQAWGTARYQSWETPLPYRGGLTLWNGGEWHRIQRDFATHRVDWTVASTRDDSPAQSAALLAPPSPATDAWRVLFSDEHRASGRGDSRRRYDQLLRELLGFDDLALFLLTYCVTQDPEDRTPEETAYRSRQIPAGVQHLISGSGGRVVDVLTHLFDSFADITRETRDAGLVRPGKTRAVTLQKPGRLEVVVEKLALVQAQLASATDSLDHLQVSQGEMEEIRARLEEARRGLAADTRLLEHWKEWADARGRLRDLRARAADLEKAAREVERVAIARRDSEEKLAAGLAEYQAPDFPFAERAARFQELIETEREKARLAAEREEALARGAKIEGEVARAGQEIRDRYAEVAGRPHLVRDFDEWSRVHAEREKLERDLGALRNETDACRAKIERTRRWAALDPATEILRARPVHRLEDLRARLPRFLQRVDESARLSAERRACETRLAGPLRAAGEASAELRREAPAFAERRERLKLEAAEAQRLAGEKEARLAELAAAESDLQQTEVVLTERLGPPDRTDIAPPETRTGARQAALAAQAEGIGQAAPTPAHFPAPWSYARTAVAKKLECVREEGRLLSRIAEAQRVIRAGLIPQVILPALGGFVLAFGGLFVATHLPTPGPNGEFLASLAAGLVVAAIVAALTYGRTRGARLRELRAAHGKLSSVRRTLVQADTRLNAVAPGLTELDGTELQAIEDRIQSYFSLSESLARLRVSAGSAQEIDRAREAAENAASAWKDAEERMAVLGGDPGQLVADWSETTRRLASVQAHLEELRAEVGPEDWPSRSLDELPSIWRSMAVLAGILTEEPSIADPRRIVARLRAADAAEWDAWVTEARALESAAARLAESQARIEALNQSEGRDESRSAEAAPPLTRLELLAARDAELALACAPFPIARPREEIEKAVEQCRALEERIAAARAQREPLDRQIAAFAERIADLEPAIASQREQLKSGLASANGDPAAALERLRKARELRERAHQAAETLAGIFQSLGVADHHDLQARLEGLRQDCAHEIERIRRIEGQAILFRELADADPEELQRRQEEIEARIRSRAEEAERLGRQDAELRDRVSEARSEGKRAGNVAILELEARALEQERETLARESEACKIAFLTLKEAHELFSQTHRERLQEAVGAIFRRLSMGPGRSTRLNESFEIEVLDGGRPCTIRQLSQGARDQLALSLRLAVAELLSEDVRLPLLLDDPFLSFDAPRLAEMRATLARVAEERQVILLSHREDLAAWGRPVSIEG